MEPDGVVSPHADPVRDWPVLAHFLSELLLDAESLVRRLQFDNPRREVSSQV